MTIEQAIEQYDGYANVCEHHGLTASQEEFEQLAAWLRELHGRRKEQEIATGEWVLKEHLWECNKCGCRINVANPLSGNNWNYYFCPHCGTKMIIAVQRF